MLSKYSNTTFIIGVSIIGFFLILTLFSKWLIPDQTKNTNLQIPQIALKDPGYSTLLYYGEQSSPLPIKSWRIEGAFLNILPQKGLSKRILISDIVPQNFTGSQEEFILDKFIKKQKFIFGTDKYGRDIFSRVIVGLRISLFVGFIAVMISIFIGGCLGLISGYYGGILDQLIQYLINVFWSIPTILLVFAIVAGFGRSVIVIFIAVGLTMWVDVARLIRGQVISLKEQNYIKASRSLGTKNLIIIFKHILPNVMSSFFVISAANFAIAILIEAGLSYLGFGVQPPTPSLGNMLNENYGFALMGKLSMSLIPALVIMLLVLGFNLAGNGLRDIFDIRK